MAFSKVGSSTKDWADAPVQHMRDMSAYPDMGDMEAWLKLCMKIMHVFDKVACLPTSPRDPWR